MKVSSKDKLQISALRDDNALYSRLYIACQTREGYLDDFFKHKNHPHPPSRAKQDKLYIPDGKSDMLPCLEREVIPTRNAPIVDAKIFDGPAIVHFLELKGIRTFHEYSCEFIKYAHNQLANTNRVDTV